MRTVKIKPGNVPKPKPDEYLYKQLFRRNAQAQFAGMAGTPEELQSEDGKAKLAAAHAATKAALGYSLEEAEEYEEVSDLASEFQWAKPTPPRSGEEEMCCSEVEL